MLLPNLPDGQYHEPGFPEGYSSLVAAEWRRLACQGVEWGTDVMGDRSPRWSRGVPLRLSYFRSTSLNIGYSECLRVFVFLESSLLSWGETRDCRVILYWNGLSGKAWNLELSLVWISDLLILCFHFPLGLERVHTELVFLFILPTVR